MFRGARRETRGIVTHFRGEGIKATGLKYIGEAARLKKNGNVKDVMQPIKRQAARQMFGRGAKADHSILGKPQQGASASLTQRLRCGDFKMNLGPLRSKPLVRNTVSFFDTRFQAPRSKGPHRCGPRRSICHETAC